MATGAGAAAPVLHVAWEWARESCPAMPEESRPMSPNPREIELAHERDASWLIALWLAIHGGDPAPAEGELVPRELQEAAALNAIEALSTALDAKTREALHHVVGPALRRPPMKTVAAKVEAERLEAMGLRITEYADARAHAQFHAHAGSTSIVADISIKYRPYCFSYEGTVICVDPPRLNPIVSPGF